MVIDMKVNLSRIKDKALVNIFGIKVENIKANGKLIE
jgi:hypothetical protein